MGSQWRLPIYFHQLCVNKMSVHELASFCADVPLRTYSLFVHKQNQLNEAIRQRLSVMSPKESVTDWHTHHEARISPGLLQVADTVGRQLFDEISECRLFAFCHLPPTTQKQRGYAQHYRQCHLQTRSFWAVTPKITSSSAVAKRPRDASCLSVVRVSFNGTKRRAESSIVSYVSYIFITACN